MKTKAIKYLSISTFLIFICLISVLSIFNTNSYTISTKADSLSQYMSFSYSYEYVVNNNASVVQEDTNVSRTGFLFISEYDQANTMVKITSNTNKLIGIGSIYNGCYIQTNNFNIDIETGFNQAKTVVKNEATNEEIISINGKNIAIQGIGDSQYSFNITLTGQGFNINARTYAYYRLKINFTLNIDTTNPVVMINNIQVTDTLVYSNTNALVQGFDAGSIYCITYYHASINTSINESSVTLKDEGNYDIYITDSAGNISDTIRLVIDKSKPNISILNTNKENVKNSYSNTSIVVNATDSISGIKNFIVSNSITNQTTTYSNQNTIELQDEGINYFTIVDCAGNILTDVFCRIDLTSPEIKIYNPNNEEITSNNAVIYDNKLAFNYSSFKVISEDTNSGIELTTVINETTNETDIYSNNEINIQTNGVYSISCKDKAGNQSNVINCIFDNVAPSITSTDEFNKATSNFFTVSISDFINCSLFVKSPNDSNFIEYPSNEYSINIDSVDGTYYFFGVDALNNRTETKSIIYNRNVPYGNLTKLDDNSYIFSYDSGTATLDGVNYVSNTIVSTEGEHKIRLVGSNGITNQYSFSVDHYYEISNITPYSCLHDEITTYTCKHCNYSYTETTRLATGSHNYEETNIEATCSSDGYTLHTCSECRDEYKTNITPKLGHEYSSHLTRSSKCNVCGLREYECSR
ncbi:MAG: hypothetical protein K5765_05425, partial [Clostridia bacterium]|nr:hypothetical protein [Clostridia bacterium]